MRSSRKSPFVMLSPSTRVIHQSLVHAGNDGKLDVFFIKMPDLNEDHTVLRTLVERNEGRPLGLSGAYLPNGTLQVLAIADATTIFLVDFVKDKNKGRTNSLNSLTTEGRDYLRDHVLGRTCGFLYAFDMGPLALALWQSHDLRIKQGIDLQSAGPPSTRAPSATIKFALANGDDAEYEDNIIRTFDDFICEKPTNAAKCSTVTPLASRAWAAHYVSQLVSMEERLSQVSPIDTFRFNEALPHFLAKSSVDSFQKDQLKPTEVTHSYSTYFDDGKKQLRVKAVRYQNKIRKGRHQQAHINISACGGVGPFAVPGQVASARGAITCLKTEGFLGGKQVGTITIMGREDPTAAEVKRAQIILMVLQGRINTDDLSQSWRRFYVAS
ncbi:hypothetical protein OG21DRAFT_1607572 [Imleria badia]|nr:hypothetical protein OG21DRAFT_1607572 [Imleria badia]